MSVQALAPPQCPVPQDEAPLQSCCPDGHVQLPPEQAAPGSQAVPHAPQLSGSVFSFVQRPLHRVSPDRHAAVTQVPLLQAWPVPQANEGPQPPQFWLSVWVSVQTLPH